MPDQLGGGPTSVLTKGLRWAAIGVEPDKTKLSVTIQSDSPQAAEALANRLPALLDGLFAQISEPPRTSISPFTKALLRSMKTQVVEDRIQVSFGSLGVAESPAVILAAVLEKVTGPISRAARKNRMRTIVLGILNYESASGSMPPGKKARDEDGTSKLSWRVHILPFL